MKFYYLDKGQAYLVSNDDCEAIIKALRGAKPVNTHGRTIYPILDPPTDRELAQGKTSRVAFVIHDGGLPVARWYWQVHEVRKGQHGAYKSLGDGLCAVKVVRYQDWNADTNKWELRPMVNHATPEQEQVLDAF